MQGCQLALALSITAAGLMMATPASSLPTIGLVSACVLFVVLFTFLYVAGSQALEALQGGPGFSSVKQRATVRRYRSM